MTNPHSDKSSDELRRDIYDRNNTIEDNVGREERDKDAIQQAERADDNAKEELRRRGEAW